MSAQGTQLSLDMPLHVVGAATPSPHTLGPHLVLKHHRPQLLAARARHLHFGTLLRVYNKRDGNGRPTALAGAAERRVKRAAGARCC